MMMSDPLSPQSSLNPRLDAAEAPLAANDEIGRGLDVSWLRWSPCIAGGLVAAALSSVLTGFGSTLGFANLSQTWRSITPTLSILSGLWILAVALASASAGGYLAGRTRDRWGKLHLHELRFRDGAHGLISWAIAVILGALVVSTLSGSIKNVGQPDPAIPISSQELGASPTILSANIDRMLRSEARPTLPDPTLRNAAGRLLTSAATSRNVSAEDRAQLVQLVRAGAGLSEADAQKRVDDSIAATRDQIGRAHHAEAIGAFMSAVSLLLAALAAWYAAEAGGRHQDSSEAPSLGWTPRRPHFTFREWRS
jgi:predicted transcriptional regulator